MPSAANYSKLRQHIVGCGVRRHKMFSSAATLDQNPPSVTASPGAAGLVGKASADRPLEAVAADAEKDTETGGLS